MSAPHDYELDYCKRCGIPKEIADRHKIGCVEQGSNVTGVTHLIARRSNQKIHEAMNRGWDCRTNKKAGIFDDVAYRDPRILYDEMTPKIGGGE